MAAQRIFKTTGYFGNFLNKPITPGDVFQFDDQSFLLLTNLNKDQHCTIVKSEPSNITLSKQCGCDVSTDASVNGNGAQLHFIDNKSGFAGLNNAVTHSLEIQELHESFIKFLHDNGYEKKRNKIVLINEVISAESGVMLFSDSKNNTDTLNVLPGNTLSSINSIASGKVTVGNTSSAVEQFISDKPFTALFAALWLKPNNLFEKLG